jgi:hypothetical protein
VPTHQSRRKSEVECIMPLDFGLASEAAA